MIRDTKSAPVWTSSQPKIDPNNPGNIGSPMKGEIIEVKVAVGDPVEKGQVVAIISAMKMEMAVQVHLTVVYFNQLLGAARALKLTKVDKTTFFSDVFC